ncbi:MAG: Tm-1-like ATP-binding domain-containing protein [Deltaproteobacteria bacterium]|nr:Tm-1-like ATP-binding domain-containing protein [Deltaproteobacteria bacterium]MBW2041636.1 Tm-1-like ATP-binding domain-containing protein [Deltaproteobacteria bacterium]MBW2131094.1 Tm-1-like ATP-binding domain-containing protein [Deltaproteobacteria bacterium]
MAIAVVGTFDTKAKEHLFLKGRIEAYGYDVFTIHVGTRRPAPFPVDRDIYREIEKKNPSLLSRRDQAIEAVRTLARKTVAALYREDRIEGVISAGGGTGTHLGTGIMKGLPIGVPKVMVSTVAAKDMGSVVGTKDITMIHSVVDILGINSISGMILDRAAGAVCGMARARWKPERISKRIALTFFGFITEAAEHLKDRLEKLGYEVIPFHANGTGGMAMEELAGEGVFDGILDLATHEFADALKNGYCRGIGPERLTPPRGKSVPRLVVPGGLDCAVLEFTRESVPEIYRDRKIFYYDFRSAVRLSREETRLIADQLSEKMNLNPRGTLLLIPSRGWSEADGEGAPLYDPEVASAFVKRMSETLDPRIEIQEADLHINEAAFADLAAQTMDAMVKRGALSR